MLFQVEKVSGEAFAEKIKPVVMAKMSFKTAAKRYYLQFLAFLGLLRFPIIEENWSFFPGKIFYE